MLSIKCIILVVVLQYVSQMTYSQASKKIFRKDYTYLEEMKSFYKIHTLRRKWEDAKDKCEMEGATLFYPNDDGEAIAVLKFWNMSLPSPPPDLFVGISTPYAKQVFETVNGERIDEVYAGWDQGEPNDVAGDEGCVILRSGGTFNDVNCEDKFRFICKKTLSSLEWNMLCDIPNTEYQYVQKLGRCYKFHSTPMTWSDAYEACYTEQSHLAVINSRDEADFLVNLTNNAPKDNVEGDYLRGAVHLGFQFKKNRWQTIVRNMPLSESGYTEWEGGQPDGKGAEKCGSMSYNGRLNNTRCDQKLFFICEHEINSLRNSQILRFGEVFHNRETVWGHVNKYSFARFHYKIRSRLINTLHIRMS